MNWQSFICALAIATFASASVLAQTDSDLVADLQYVINKHRAWVAKNSPKALWKTPPCRVGDAMYWYGDGTKADPAHHFVVVCTDIDGDMVVTTQPAQPDDGVSQYYASCYKHFFWKRRNCDVRLNQWYRERGILK